jgi:hypothetical protein
MLSPNHARTEPRPFHRTMTVTALGPCRTGPRCVTAAVTVQGPIKHRAVTVLSPCCQRATTALSLNERSPCFYRKLVLRPRCARPHTIWRNTTKLVTMSKPSSRYAASVIVYYFRVKCSYRPSQIRATSWWVQPSQALSRPGRGRPLTGKKLSSGLPLGSRPMASFWAVF